MGNVKSALKDLDTASGKAGKSFAGLATKLGLVAAAGMGLKSVITIGAEFGKEMAKTKSVTFDASKTTEQLNKMNKDEVDAFVFAYNETVPEDQQISRYESQKKEVTLDDGSKVNFLIQEVVK